MKKIPLSLLLMSIVAGSGCAWYNIQPVSTGDVAAWNGQKSPPEGYIIYQPELYFAATITTETGKDAKGNDEVKTSVAVAPLYLPNYTKAYRVTTHNFLAKADFAFEFENGWKLTKLSDKGDNSTVANTLAGQLATMLKAAGLGVSANANPPKKRVILYRPTYDESTGFFNGFSEVGVMINE